MKNLFTPVDFSTPNTPESNSIASNDLDLEAIRIEMTIFHNKVMELVTEIERGYSPLKGPTQIKGSPIFTVIDRMNHVPTKENIKIFFEIALQDLGARFKKACEDIFNNGQFSNLNKVIK